MIEEIFKDIAGFEGLYQVSNLGRVKTLKSGKIKATGNCRGYLYVTLSKNSIYKSYSVHRLVAQAFLENPDNLPQVNHIDQNKQNNKVSNLEWCDNQYNQRYSNAKKIGAYKDGKLIKEYDAIVDVKQDGFHLRSVYAALSGQYKSSGGYHWQYLD